KQEAAESLLEFVKVVPQAGSIVGDIIARNMDWPGADEVANRLEKTLPAQLQPPPSDPQQQAAQMQAQQAAQAQAAKQQQFADLSQQFELTLKQAQAKKLEAEALRTMVEAHAMGNQYNQSAPQTTQQPNPYLAAFQDQHAATQTSLDTEIKQQQLRRMASLAD